jgi:hypothetical protein
LLKRRGYNYGDECIETVSPADSRGEEEATTSVSSLHNLTNPPGTSKKEEATTSNVGQNSLYDTAGPCRKEEAETQPLAYR